MKTVRLGAPTHADFDVDDAAPVFCSVAVRRFVVLLAVPVSFVGAFWLLSPPRVQLERRRVADLREILMGLLPIMRSHGAGADVMKRIAAPMVGGVVTSFILELLIYPVIFTIWKWRRHGNAIVSPTRVRVEVEDTGPGLPSSIATNAFDP